MNNVNNEGEDLKREGLPEEVDEVKENEKRTITDLLYGVIVKPVDTLRYVADNKPVLAGILIYVAVAWLGAFSSLPRILGPSGQTYELRQFPWFNPRMIAIFLIVGTPFISLISLVIMSGVFHLFARLLKGKGDFAGLISASGFANFPSALATPFGLLGLMGNGIGSKLYSLISFPFTIWVIVLQVIAIRENYKLSTGRSVATLFIPLIILVAFIVLLVIGVVVLFFSALSNR